MRSCRKAVTNARNSAGAPFFGLLLLAPPDPRMFFYRTDPQDMMMYRLSPGIKTQESIVQLPALFNRYDPAFPYGYSFADEAYAANSIWSCWSVTWRGYSRPWRSLSPVWGCLGLTAYVEEQRTKEIGIRKVMGAIDTNHLCYVDNPSQLLILQLACKK